MDWDIRHEEGGYLLVTTDGHFSLADQQQMFNELRALPVASARSRILFDNRRLDLAGSNLDVITRSVQVVQKFMEEERIERLAGLVDQGVNFGVGRQFEALSDMAGGHGFRLFNDGALARRWLCGEMD